MYCLETRVEGNSQAWQALRSAIEMDEGISFIFFIRLITLLATAFAILQAVGLRLVGKTIQMTYDNQGKNIERKFIININRE